MRAHIVKVAPAECRFIGDSIVPGETREFPKLELVAIIRNSTCYCINAWDTHGDGSKHVKT